MSLRAKLTLTAAVAFTTGTIYFVHWNQKNESEQMYKGVIKDEARVAQKKAQREEEFRISQIKRERYEAVQTVNSNSPETVVSSNRS